MAGLIPQSQTKSIPHVGLAPMEGLVDPLVREVWSEIGGFDQCTSEFIRVTHQVLPEKVFLREVPELAQGSRTRAGTPVAVQLLGGDPELMAANAEIAAGLGAFAVDLNFGCPAPTVNRHDGGATLLKSPSRIEAIVSAVRKAVPSQIPVTAKLRLGFESTDLCLENCLAAASGGASRLTVHCRTKKDLYRPPAFWDWIPAIREGLSARGHSPEIIANGEIWTLADFLRCQEATQADGYLLGRGAIANPFLARVIKSHLQLNPDPESTTWDPIEKLMPEYFERSLQYSSKAYALARMKQWLKLMTQVWQEAEPLFEQIKTAQTEEQVRSCFRL